MLDTGHEPEAGPLLVVFSTIYMGVLMLNMRVRTAARVALVASMHLWACLLSLRKCHI